LAKDDSKQAELQSVLYHLVDVLRIIAILIQPVMTQTPKLIFKQLGISDSDHSFASLEIGLYPAVAQVIAKGEPIFPRLDKE
ncbi:methionine--tRNA ligase, partial [Aerococcus sp. UMB9870]|nr:methionine--tRNA ligase [Aerococcus sp. UMB9870]